MIVAWRNAAAETKMKEVKRCTNGADAIEPQNRPFKNVDK